MDAVCLQQASGWRALCRLLQPVQLLQARPSAQGTTSSRLKRSQGRSLTGLGCGIVGICLASNRI